MPIRAENKDKYPKNWISVVVPRIRARSGNRCECIGECGVEHNPNADISDADVYRCQRVNGEDGYHDWRGEWHIAPPTMRGEYETDDRGAERKVIRITLTVAHLNHEPEDCRDENLRHWCQGCHNRYDAPNRRAGIHARARAQRARGDLFQCEEVS